LFRGIFLIVLLFSSSALAEQSFTSFYSPRFTLHIEATNQKSVSLSPEQLATKAMSLLNETHSELTRIFKSDTNGSIELKFLSPEEFKKHTGAPEWTSAMYLKDEISIPITPNSVKPKEMHRAIRHEYVHAFVAKLSKYKCPAWLDEGLAQIIEGHANPILAPSLRHWASINDVFDLNDLRDGFTTMENSAVPAAYAQSYFATRMLIQTKGISAVTKYLRLLSKGKTNERSFEVAFRMKQHDFERRLSRSIKRWVDSGKEEI